MIIAIGYFSWLKAQEDSQEGALFVFLCYNQLSLMHRMCLRSFWMFLVYVAICSNAEQFTPEDVPTTSRSISQQPLFPHTFQASYVSPVDAKNTSGVYALGTDKFGKAAQITTFEDGTRDHLCQFFFNATACVQLMTKGWRYMYWPKLQKCCKCCSFANGCGPLDPKWVQNQSGNIIYEGLSTVSYSASVKYRCHKWNAVGLEGDPNYYYQHLDQAAPRGHGTVPGPPCEIDGLNYLHTPQQKADDQYIFDKASISTANAVELFEVPSYCADDSYCGTNACDPIPSTASMLTV